jgi:hypothetical protein
MVEIELDPYAASQVWDNRGSASHVRRALELAEPLGDAGLFAQALAFRAMSDFLCGRGIDWPTLGRALALEDPARVVPLHRTPTGVEALLLLYAGRLSEARQLPFCDTPTCRRAGDESDRLLLACPADPGRQLKLPRHTRRKELVATATEGKSMCAFACALRRVKRASRRHRSVRRECDVAACCVSRPATLHYARWVSARCRAEYPWMMAAACDSDWRGWPKHTLSGSR